MGSGRSFHYQQDPLLKCCYGHSTFGTYCGIQVIAPFMHTLKLIFDPMGLYVLAQHKTGQRSCSDTNFNYRMNGGGPL